MLESVRTESHRSSVVCRAAGAIGILLCAAGSWAQDIEELAPLVLQELKADTMECPEDLQDGWTCGQYGSDFSRLKFELEVELDLKDFEARPLSGWRLRGGSYERSWAVHGFKVTMKFGRKTHVVALRQEPLDEEPAADPESRDGDDDDDDDGENGQNQRGA